MNTLIITDEEAEMFKKYMFHHDLFVMLEEKGAFAVQYGKVVLNFGGGILQSINKEEVIFKR